ncbi:MAG: hypothetical protein HY298_07560 [Verrucomicrobia bacterium]|nr:hypothetical protein [Verrucomicrobiota bacterium]
MKRLICSFVGGVLAFALRADDSWPTALSQMPLNVKVTQLNRTNCVELMLRAFQSNDTVKALIFMPGATDEFYFFRRAHAVLTNTSPTLLDAVQALTNQTLIHLTFRPPMLLLHTLEDPVEPLFHIESWEAEERLRKARFVPHALYNDRDWDHLLPTLSKKLKMRFLPYRNTRDSWHFFRHSFAGWDLTGWEALEAVSLAGKTTFTVQKRRVIFAGDTRIPQSKKP